jgi:hypothetical protein
MPRLVLTAEQAELVEEILDAQSDRRTGFIGALNFALDRETGERMAELNLIALDWKDAVKICRLARKLSEEANCERRASAGR